MHIASHCLLSIITSHLRSIINEQIKNPKEFGDIFNQISIMISKTISWLKLGPNVQGCQHKTKKRVYIAVNYILFIRILIKQILNDIENQRNRLNTLYFFLCQFEEKMKKELISTLGFYKDNKIDILCESIDWSLGFYGYPPIDITSDNHIESVVHFCKIFLDQIIDPDIIEQETYSAKLLECLPKLINIVKNKDLIFQAITENYRSHQSKEVKKLGDALQKALEL